MLIGYSGCATNEQGESIGVKGVGKDTAAECVRQLIPNSNTRTFAFADKLKDLVCHYFSLDRSCVDTPERKEVELDEYKGWTFRMLLEQMGDVVRMDMRRHLPDLNLDTNSIFIRSVYYKIRESKMSPIEKLTKETFDLSNYECFDLFQTDTIDRLGYSFEELQKGLSRTMSEIGMPIPVSVDGETTIQVTDVRFEEERQMLKELKFNIVQINRIFPGASKPVNTHRSNRLLTSRPDFVITNDGTKEELMRKISEMLRMLRMSCRVSIDNEYSDDK